ncbi:hypothetical protein [Bradyrhizobium cenepequi]|uniref:hypothetical protein n=1 Tax=Bradyrhizobium cenepequi TaxID=2821403 RepID=UPI001CE2390B|nr:hypothetical protein [Bradyrhizobium cenepequi]
MTTKSPKLLESSQRRKSAQEEVARSLERELDLLAEERKDRARLLGLDSALAAPNLNKTGE